MKLSYTVNPKIINEELDSKLFKVLLRSLKESGEFQDVVKRFKRFSELMRSCYNSRNNHRSETIYLNATYWPCDCSLKPLNSGTWALYMYYIRLINLYPDEEAKKMFKFLKMSDRLKSVTIRERDKLHLDSDIDEIEDAFTKCGVREQVNAHMTRLKGVAYGIPF